MITIRRGTTNEFVVALTDENGSAYSISEDDKLIFGVKKTIKQNDYIFSKTVEASAYDELKGGYVVSLIPEDTQELAFGDYVYDVGLQTAEGEFYIVCPCDTFTIADTVTERA